jgi:uncharacterized protein involved in exopolysaccharide biosynthesis
MARPIEQDALAAIRALAQDVQRQKGHMHPGMVTDPETITGSRASVGSILEQILTALDAAGIIIDETTG